MDPIHVHDLRNIESGEPSRQREVVDGHPFGLCDGDHLVACPTCDGSVTNVGLHPVSIGRMRALLRVFESVPRGGEGRTRGTRIVFPRVHIENDQRRVLPRRGSFDDAQPGIDIRGRRTRSKVVPFLRGAHRARTYLRPTIADRRTLPSTDGPRRIDDLAALCSPQGMQIDEKALEILDRKRARLDSIGKAGDHMTWFAELPPLLRWVLSVPILHAYVKQILAMHDRDEAELVRVVDRAILALPPLGVELRRDHPSTASDGDWPGPLRWTRFDAAIEASTATAGREARRELAQRLAFVLRARADQAWKDAVKAETNDGLANLYDRIAATADEVTFALQEWNQLQGTSPRSAFVRLIDFCRALQPPPDEMNHWTDFLPRERFKPHIDNRSLKENCAREWSEGATALGRFVEELHVLAASTLSRRVVIERFKERSTWYDKARLREIAERGRGLREDRLTLELARYLHDAGLFVLVRPRVTNLEPDIVGLQGLAVEAKAYASSASARADIVHGFDQLHAYMTSLETEAMRVTEGFLVAFRLGGPIYETPPTIDTGRFLIHSLTIDLGESEDSGRNQPASAKITEEEIFQALSRAPAEVSAHLAHQRIGFAHGRTSFARGAAAKRARWPPLARSYVRLLTCERDHSS